MPRISKNTVFRGIYILRTKTTKTMKLTAPLQTQVRRIMHRELQLISSKSELVSSYSRSRFTASTKRSIFKLRIDVLMRCLDMWARTPRGVATHWHNFSEKSNILLLLSESCLGTWSLDILTY